MTKYNREFIKYVIEEYINNPYISQAELAKKHNVPIGTMIGWLRSKTNGLTQFQRYKRNRDNVIRKRWESLQNSMVRVKMKKKAVAEDYGLTQQMVYRIIKQK